MPIANAKEDHLITFVRIRTGSQFPADGRSHNPISVSEPYEPILAINSCRVALICFAFQTLVFNQPAVAVDSVQMKNMLCNIHADYGLILLAHFDSPCSLVRLHS